MKVEIIDGPLKVQKAGKPKFRTARANGHVIKVRVVDADSDAFGSEFFEACKASVRRARKDNRELKVGG